MRLIKSLWQHLNVSYFKQDLLTAAACSQCCYTRFHAHSPQSVGLMISMHVKSQPRGLSYGWAVVDQVHDTNARHRTPEDIDFLHLQRQMKVDAAHPKGIRLTVGLKVPLGSGSVCHREHACLARLQPTHAKAPINDFNLGGGVEIGPSHFFYFAPQERPSSKGATHTDPL